MTSLQSAQLDLLNRPVKALGHRIRQSLAPVGPLPGILVWIRTVDGTTIPVVGGSDSREMESGAGRQPADSGDVVFSFTQEDGVQIVVRGDDSQASSVKLVSALLQSSLRAIEAERREELLLEELGSNWESLDALYEISTEALRFGDIKEALRRLIVRLTTLQEGLKSALFIRREGTYYPLVGTDQEFGPLTASQLGPVEKAVTEMQVVLVNQPAASIDEQACWRNAASLAAAPFAWEGSVGFVVVWNETKGHGFDSSVVRMLEAITYQASVMMQGDRLNRKVRENELLAQEVEIASSIQQMLLLANAPQNLPSFEIASCSLPSQRIDGDFHDFFQHPNGTLDVLLGDVMGKGVAAALLGAATKSQFLRATANLALRSTGGAPRPAGIVTRAASRLSDRLISLDRFVTVCYARFDTLTRKLVFVDSGHTSMICESKSREACALLRGNDLPLGVLPDYRCQEHSVDYRPGDTYLLYSDGVTECRSPDGELFGAERLAECVQNWSSLGPALLIQQIRKEAAYFAGSEKFSDDFSCIAVKVKLRQGEVEPLASRSAIFDCSSRSLAAFRGWLVESAELVGAGLGEEDVARMQLACGEVFANCVIHAPEVAHTNPLDISANIFADSITLQIRHRGPAFDPLAVPPPDFDGSRESGFGIYIVLRSSDEASFSRQPDGVNVITLSFLRSTVERNS
jgi:sigma-B regulation protein RsbU (phosphoserine phosphatase)